MPLVEEIDLTGQLEFPETLIGMVVAQPYTELTQNEPFRCLPERVDDQLRAISRTLDISLARPHGQEKTHFTVFPEYSIPGLRGVALVDDYLASDEWPTGTVVIGGVDGLIKDDYVSLLEAGATAVHSSNQAGELQPGEWVNCCVTWIKLSSGVVKKWVQPKITPSYLEAVLSTQAMYRGKSVFMFKAHLRDRRTARFFTLVCFDWVGSVGGKVIWNAIAEEMEEDAQRRHADSNSVSWTFVIQHNDKPNHTAFLEQIKAYFNQTLHPRLVRNQACLVMVNRAGRKDPGRSSEYAGAAVINSSLAGFFKQKCPATFSSGGSNYRPNNQLETLSDCFFREAGACIHSFAQRNAASVVGGAVSKAVSPVEQAFVHAFDDAFDPRRPGSPVPCSLKRFHDELDQVRTLAEAHPNASLAHNAKASLDHLVTSFRQLEATRLENIVRLLSPQLKARKNAEEWGGEIASALTMLSHALSVTGVADAAQTFTDPGFHASPRLGSTDVNVIAVRATTHEEAVKHVRDELPRSRIPITVISRDEDNTEWIPEFGNFMARSDAPYSRENSITNPEAALRFVGYHSVLAAYLRAKTPAELNQELSDALFK
ncbi:hypothetical protein [Pseudoxanthomonas composti]|uniref:Uncharacterized protein n=1 Tax=Pseudoxanthomonas composti TaxID=2137479 RepID=A0A4Q1JV65_9GAMM|nr:hypothetical protein [Pseudoxanthomonas composti]RXR03477.1 hypothetical protein EPA99_13675 [Pseudoxanthomonas composti]